MSSPQKILLDEGSIKAFEATADASPLTFLVALKGSIVSVLGLAKRQKRELTPPDSPNPYGKNLILELKVVAKQLDDFLDGFEGLNALGGGEEFELLSKKDLPILFRGKGVGSQAERLIIMIGRFQMIFMEGGVGTIHIELGGEDYEFDEFTAVLNMGDSKVDKELLHDVAFCLGHLKFLDVKESMEKAGFLPKDNGVVVERLSITLHPVDEWFLGATGMGSKICITEQVKAGSGFSGGNRMISQRLRTMQPSAYLESSFFSGFRLTLQETSILKSDSVESRVRYIPCTIFFSSNSPLPLHKVM
ncbi:hypothetical protein B0J14DRAFT_555579 [Halenospora varia]|nr:hypothetical protein B0J14DRAFT_555579 [Halenospora varia]